MAENERRRIRQRVFTHPARPFRFRPPAEDALDDRQFSEWYGLMVRAVSHEVSNSILTLHSISLKSGEGHMFLVSRVIEEFNLIRALSEYSRENPPECILSPALATHLEGIPKESCIKEAPASGTSRKSPLKAYPGSVPRSLRPHLNSIPWWLASRNLHIICDAL